MSENPVGPLGEGNDQPSWEEMLREILGEEGAQQVMDQLKAQGIDPEVQMPGMLNVGNFNAVVAQVRDMLDAAGDGKVNWKLAEQVARETLGRSHPDRLSLADADEARDALRTANLWLDPATSLDPSAAPDQAWSRLDWLEHCLPTFKNLTEPVGEQLTRVFVDTLNEHMAGEGASLQTFFGQDPSVMISSVMASLMGVQFGMALSELAVASFGASDAGLPLVEGHSAALVPANIRTFGEGLDIDEQEVLLFLSVREQAASRLYTRISWLRPQILDTVAAYARDIQLDTSSIEEQVRDFATNPSAMQELDVSDLFSPEPSEYQRGLLARLEHTLSLVEGWINVVSSQAVAAALPNTRALTEMLARRAATDSPINTTFGPLVDLELRPRKIREATAFWQLATTRLGIEGRDALWAHPDILPTQEALENPEAFFEPAPVEDELDMFLSSLLNEAESAGERENGSGDDVSGESTGDSDADGHDPEKGNS